MPKLPTRLSTLKKLVLQNLPYHHIWDVCCDHGYLGMALLQYLENNHTSDYQIHFVDNVAHIMHTLETSLAYKTATLENWHTHCLDAKKLSLDNYKAHRHLLIIAGVGGNLTADIVQSIIQNNRLTTAVDFLLCPVQRNYDLRQALIKQDLRLKTETLIKENNRFYEAILLTTDQTFPKVSNVGLALWSYTNTTEKQNAEEYLQQTLNHYQKVQFGFQKKQKPEHVKQTQVIIDAYQSVVITPQKTFMSST